MIILNQLLTKEEINPIYPSAIPRDFFTNLKVLKEDESLLIRIVTIRKRKIIQYAMQHDTDQDFESKLSNEELIFYNVLRSEIKKLNEGLLEIPLGYFLQPSNNASLPIYLQQM